MSLMLDFYGLREHPFWVSPNPRYLYPSLQHREALAALISGVENLVGFAALIAEPGTGKTTLLFDVLGRFHDRANTAFVFNTQCDGLELLRQIFTDLQIPDTDSERDMVRLHQKFKAFVANHHRTKPVVIIIDEAQNLDNSALETLRLLSNFEAADRKLLHIILAGQPLLREKLRSPSLTQLLQRITIISRLGNLAPDETAEYIAFRLRTAGYEGPPLFSDEAMAKIKIASRGVPREINRICINALQMGFNLQQREMGVEVIRGALSALRLSSAVRTEAPRRLDGPQIETGLRITPIEAKDPETMAAERSVVEPSLYLRLDERGTDSVSDSVLPEPNPYTDARAGVSKELHGAQRGPEALNASDRPGGSYPCVDLGDEVVEAFLSELNLNGAPRPGPFNGSNGAKPQFTSVEPRVLKLFSPPKVSRVPVKPVETRVCDTPAEPAVRPIHSDTPAEPAVRPIHSDTPAQPAVRPIHYEPWATNVRIDPWAQGAFRLSEGLSSKPKTQEPAAKPREDEPSKVQSGISTKDVLLLFAAFVVALLLYMLVTTHR